MGREEEFNYRRNPPEFMEQDTMSGSDANPFGEPVADPYAAAAGGGGGLPSIGGGLPSIGGGGGAADSGGLPSLGGGLPSFGGGFDNGTPGGFGSNLGGPDMFGQQPQQAPPQNQSISDRAIDAAGKAGIASAKASMQATKAVMGSVRDSNAKIWTRAGARSMRLALYVVPTLLFAQIVGIFVGMEHNILMPLVGTLIGSGVVGTLMWSMNYEKGKKLVGEPSTPYEETADLNSMMDSAYAEEPEIDVPTYEPDDDDEDDNDNWLETDDEYDDFDDDEEEPQSADIDAALESVPDITPGTQTRAFLFEQYKKVFSTFSPGFNEWEVFTEEDAEVMDMDDYLRDACLSKGVKDENVPMVTKVRENAFLIEVTATRRQGPALNLPAITEEFASVYAASEAVDPDTGLPDPGVYAVYRSTGMTITFLVYKRVKNVLVGIGDAYKTEANYMLDTSNKMPVILGVGENANIMKLDFAGIYSMLISGQPRSGKSWEVLAIVLQIAMYCSPRDVVFHAMDSKNEGSDFYGLNLPHIKSFAGDVPSILKTLRWVMDVEGPRRKRIHGELGHKNYNSLIKEYPEQIENMPRLYLVMDELMALFAKTTKEEETEIKDMMGAIVSQYPGFGIYFMGVPHRIQNDIIPKSVSELVPFKVAVAASAGEIETATGAKHKDFPYNITGKVGESAVSCRLINNGTVTYMRGIAVHPDDNETARIVDFVRALWSRLDHEHYHGPRIDFHDKKNGIFDNYSCGAKSHDGGYTALGTGGGTNTPRGAGTPSNEQTQEPLLRGMTGGFVSGSLEGNSARTDGSDVADVSDGWDDGDAAFNSLIR